MTADLEAIEPRGRHPWDSSRETWVLIVLALAQFANVMDFMIVMPLGPALQESLAISAGQFGLILSCYTFAASVSGLLSALVIDRFDRKKAFLGLYVGFLVGTLLCGLAASYETLLAARTLTGVFGGVVGSMAHTIVADVFPESRRGRAMGIVMSAFAMASIAGVPAGIWLGTHWDWRAPFFAIVALGLFALFVGLWALPSLRSHRAGMSDHAPGLIASASRLAGTLAEPLHQRAFAFMALIMFGGFVIVPYISMHLVLDVKIRQEDLFWVYMAGGACTMISSPMIGALADRIGKPLAFWIIAPISAAVMIGMTSLPPVPLWAACLICAMLMVANSGRVVVAMAIIASCVDPARRGGFMSVNSSVQHLSMGLGALVASRILTQGPTGELSGYPIAGALGMTATLLSLTLVHRLARPAADPAKSEV